MAPDGHRHKITSTLKITGLEREDNERGLIRCKSKNGIEETSIRFRLNVLCTPSACNVHFVQLTNDTIMANIEHPTDNGGFSITHLRVLVYTFFDGQSSLISNYTCGLDQEFIKLKHLASSSKFQFLCQANNALGYGEVGKFDAQTLGKPQSSVRTNVSQSNCTSATLEFHSETVGINSQIRYEVLYGLAKDNDTFSIASAILERSNCPVTTLFNLEGNTKYAAVVRELNAYGAGTFSDPVHFETLCVADADGTQMPVWLIAVVVALVVGAALLVAFILYKNKLLKKELNKWLSKRAQRKTMTLIDEHFCNNPPIVLLLGQSEQSSLVNIFEFVINLAVNEEAMLRGAENCHESQPAKLMMHEIRLYKDTSADDRRINQRGPTFLEPQGLLAKKQTEYVRPIVMMLALGYLPVEKHLDEVYDDFSQAIRNAGDGDKPSSGQCLPDNVLDLLCPEKIVEGTLDGDDKQRRLRELKRVMEEKIQFYKNTSTPAEETKPHIVLLVWNAKYYKQLLSQLQAIKDALLAARLVEEKERGRIAAGTTDLKLYLLFTSGYVLRTKEITKLEQKVVSCLPSLEDKVLFVSNCIALQSVKVENRLEVIRVLEVVLKPNEEKHTRKIVKLVRQLKRRLTCVFDQDECDGKVFDQDECDGNGKVFDQVECDGKVFDQDDCDGKEDENQFLRALKNLDLAASGVINVTRKMSREFLV